MTFVIVNLEEGKEYKKHYWNSIEEYVSERGAKIACSKLIKKTSENWRVMSYNEWKVFKELKFPVKMVERVNLMSGTKYMEAEDTLLCCSPASETFWSM